MRALYRTAPSTPYTITAQFDVDAGGIQGTSQSNDSIGFGIGFRDGTGKVIRFNFGYDAGRVFITQKWTTTTSGPSTYTNKSIPLGNWTSRFWMRITDNATN